jgi:hypothetical protein
MQRDVTHKGTFTVESTKKEGGHEETCIYHRGRLIHKRWRPESGKSYSRTFPKYGSAFNS